MTASELSTIARQGLHATVVVVDNDGYTVERAIHGPEQVYNDIARWDWRGLVTAMAPEAGVQTHRATTPAQLAAALASSRHSPGLTLIEAAVGRLDVPPLLSQIAREAGRANRPSAPAS
jgi:TPP-dependent 2-oxoacid decarboxylase